MLAYKQQLTVNDPDKVILRGLPLHRGQRIEVVVMAAEDDDRDTQNVAEDLKQGLVELVAVKKKKLKARPIRDLLSEL